MLRKLVGGLVLAAVPLLAITQARPASATCTYGGCPDGFSSTCYNLKTYKWCPASNGISTVYLTNNGSYESAFDWARNEISSPHNGVGNSLKLAQKSSGGDIKVYDYTGSSSWWGLASNYVTVSGSNKCIDTVKVQINKSYMSSTVRKKYTILHELGHAVGLDHSCVCPRTMNPAVGALEKECQRRNKLEHFRVFELLDLAPDPEQRPSYAAVAAQVGISTTDVNNRLTWARRELRRLVLDKLREITATEEEFRSEAFAVLGIRV